MEAGTVPPNWSDLVKYSSELATTQDFSLAETWHGSRSSQSNLKAIDNPVVNPYSILSDQHLGRN